MINIFTKLLPFLNMRYILPTVQITSITRHQLIQPNWYTLLKKSIGLIIRTLHVVNSYIFILSLFLSFIITDNLFCFSCSMKFFQLFLHSLLDSHSGNDLPPFFSGYHTSVINQLLNDEMKARFLHSLKQTFVNILSVFHSLFLSLFLSFSLHIDNIINFLPLDFYSEQDHDQTKHPQSLSSISSSSNISNNSQQRVEELILSDPVTATAVARMEGEGYIVTEVRSDSFDFSTFWTKCSHSKILFCLFIFCSLGTSQKTRLTHSFCFGIIFEFTSALRKRYHFIMWIFSI